MSSLLAPCYSDSDDDQSAAPVKVSSSHASVPASTSIVAAPVIANELAVGNIGLVSATTTSLTYNTRVEVMYAPTNGPANPLTGLTEPKSALRNTLNGYVEEAFVSSHHFDTQFIGTDKSSLLPGSKRKPGKLSAAKVKRVSPWDAPPEEDNELREEFQDVEDAVEIPAVAISAEEVATTTPAVKKTSSETSILHGKAPLYDYQGRTYMHRPSGLKPRKYQVVQVKQAPEDINTAPKTSLVTAQCYIPEKCLHTYSGHSKGVNSIRFLPYSGHLLLSGSMDCKVKLWDVYNDRRVLRTFLGHSRPVRQVRFNNQGDRFLSVSYDRYVKLWDTETGQCIQRFTTDKTPFCAEFHPWENKQNEFLVGQSDKKIQQWDIKSNQITQTYDEHLGAVNSILFADQGRRFISTSDDKKILIWEYGIPVVIKHIAEPDMHSMPTTTLHPSTNDFVGQSLDNQILVFSIRNNCKLNRNKRFVGHEIAGYAAGMAFSPDGRFLCSGDSSGRVFYWDYTTSRVLERTQAHTENQIVMDVQWHPVEASRVATCSWDGTVKLWDGRKNK